MGQKAGISPDVSSLFSRLGLGGIESYQHFSPRPLGETNRPPKGFARPTLPVERAEALSVSDPGLPSAAGDGPSETLPQAAPTGSALPESVATLPSLPAAAFGDILDAAAAETLPAADGPSPLARAAAGATPAPSVEASPRGTVRDESLSTFTSSTLPGAASVEGPSVSLTPPPGALFELPGLGAVNLDLRPALPPTGRSQPERTPRVVFHSIQGGAGVSTLATGLAAQLAQAGWAPRILDLKGTAEASLFFPQARVVPGADALVLGREGSSRAVGLLCPSTLDIPGHGVWPVSLIERCEPQCRELFAGLTGQAFMICDLPSGHHELWRRSLADADLNVIPLRPDAFALRAAEAMLRVLESEPGQALFVLNTFDPQDAVHCQVEASLRELLGPQLAPLPVMRDPGLAASMLKGEPFSTELFRGAGFQALYASCALAALQRLHQA